jgi:hypothetical protein
MAGVNAGLPARRPPAMIGPERTRSGRVRSGAESSYFRKQISSAKKVKPSISAAAISIAVLMLPATSG